MKKSKIALSTIIAAILGVIVGLLTAPKSGKETREDIARTSNAAKSKLEKKLKSAYTELELLIGKTGKNIGKKKDDASKLAGEKLEAAKLVQTRLKAALSAVRNGEADDKELDDAVKEAHDSIRKLKNYLKGQK